MYPWHKIYQELKQSLSSREFIRIYQLIRSQHKMVQDFGSPEGLIEFFHDRESPKYRERDEILRFLIDAYQKGEPYRILGAYFLIFFQPGLKRIYFRYKGKYPGVSDQELSHQIWLFCLETIGSINLIGKSAKIASHIVGTTANRIRKWILGQIKESKEADLFIQEGIKSVDRRSLEVPARELQQILTDCLPQSLAIEGIEVKKILDHLVKIRVISKSESLLILNNVINGIPLVRLAKGYNSKNYKAMQKRKERALKAIKNYLKSEMEKLLDKTNT